MVTPGHPWLSRHLAFNGEWRYLYRRAWHLFMHRPLVENTNKKKNLTPVFESSARRMSRPSRYLDDEELMALSRSQVMVEGYQGLIKIEKTVAVSKGARLRIGLVVTGNSVIGTQCDLGLAGGAVIENSQIARGGYVTGGGTIFQSRCGPHLRDYASHIRGSTVGSNFIIRSMAEIKESAAGDHNRANMFSRIYRCQMGDYNVVGSHSVLFHATLGDKNEIADYCKIEYCQIGNSVRIGSYVHIKGRADEQMPAIGDDVIIGDHAVIQAGVQIHSGARIPDFAIVFMQDGKTVMSVMNPGGQ